MRRTFLLLLLLLLPASLAAAPVRPLAERQLETAPKEVILGWINQYRHHPEPEQAPLAVRGLSRLGILTDTEGAGVYVGFLAGVFAKNPDKVDALIARMFPLSGEHQWAIVRAIAYSGPARLAHGAAAQCRAHAGAARDDRAISRRQAADARPGADREGRDVGRARARADAVRQLLQQAQEGIRAGAHAGRARHAVGLFLRDRRRPPALAHHPDAALGQGARRSGKAHPRQHGEVHARH